MRISVFPLDSNPYQRLLYDEMRRLGVQVSYLGQRTPWHAVNILLLPLEIIARRICGVRLLHLHWVFPFAFPVADRFPGLRRITQLWFFFWLWTCRMLDIRLVWTAHNVLPHETVFADDVAARKALVLTSDLVLAHSSSTLASLAEIGAIPRRSAVVPHGPIAPHRPLLSLRVPRSDGGACRFLFIGHVKRYKGVEDLLDAFAAMPNNISAHLTIAGQCNDLQLRARLAEFEERTDVSIFIRPNLLLDAEVTDLIAAADVVVLPFRRITTSGSAMLALSHGRPLIVPDIPAMADLPDTAVIRYDGSVSGLSASMVRIASSDAQAVASMSDAACGWAYRISWHEIADKTKLEMSLIFDGISSRSIAEPKLSRDLCDTAVLWFILSVLGILKRIGDIPLEITSNGSSGRQREVTTPRFSTTEKPLRFHRMSTSMIRAGADRDLANPLA